MKAKQHLFVVFLMLPFIFQAQEALLNIDRLWTMVQTNCEPQGNVYSSHYLKISGDTSIQGNLYKKLVYSIDESREIWFDYGGYIREASDGKVYFRRSGLGEGLIYDFSAKAGDTVVILNYDLIPEPLNMVVILEDSLLLEDGWHRILVLEDDNYPGEDTWIEGVGSVSGLVKSGMSAFGSSCGAFDLLCTSDGMKSVYVNPEYPSCWYFTTRIDEKEEISSLKLYPNPVRDRLNIEGEFLNKGEACRVKLVDFTGRVVLDAEINTDEIDLSTLVSGMYFLHLQTSSASYSSRILKY